MTWAQILGFILAATAAVGFFQTGRLLGVDGQGWPAASAWQVLALDLVAAFWVGAAVFVLQSAAVANSHGLALALAFAISGIWLLIITLAERRPRTGGPR